MKVSTPFNRYVPKSVVENLKWRKAIHKKVLANPSYANIIKAACSQDPLFFINGFGWTYNTRIEPNPKVPFILYPFQEEAIIELIQAFNSYDILIEKSRDMGASWMCIVSTLWAWRFHTGKDFLYNSRVQELVDQAGNPKSMFWKFDYFLDNLPVWLQPFGYDKKRHRHSMHVENPEFPAAIDGESTTGNVSVGDRRFAIVLDEFSANAEGYGILTVTQYATHCRVFNFTPRGTGNAAYDMRQTNIKKVRLHWTLHPEKSRGLYNRKNNCFNIIDKDYWAKIENPELEMERCDKLILDKGVSLPEEKLRSPWYAVECDRSRSAQEVAQELDIDYLGSGFQYFDSNLIYEAIRKDAMLPILVGELEHDNTTGDPIHFRDSPDGKLKLWTTLNREGKVNFDHQYTIGVDVSGGSGASNSCAAIWDNVTCEKIGEYVNSRIRPEAFATQIRAIAKWLNNAYLIWESNNAVGLSFGSKLLELGYGNIYLRKNDATITGKVSDIPGWASTRDTKVALLGAYRDALERGDCINRSRDALEECLEFVHTPDGGIEHSRALNKADPSGARGNHGDRVIADALAFKGLHERARRPEAEQPTIPAGCLKWRMNQRELDKVNPNKELQEGW